MRRVVTAAAAVVMLLGVPRITEAFDITYSIQDYPADQNGAALSGFITTDGVIGTLTASDILSWSWTITPSGGTPFTLASSDNGARVIVQGAVVASKSSITIAESANGSDLALYDVLAGSPEYGSDLEYQRSPSQTSYSGTTAYQGVWTKYNPAMGGTDPWGIGGATAVPEPSFLILVGLGAVGFIGYGFARKRNAMRAA